MALLQALDLKWAADLNTAAVIVLIQMAYGQPPVWHGIAAHCRALDFPCPPHDPTGGIQSPPCARQGKGSSRSSLVFRISLRARFINKLSRYTRPFSATSGGPPIRSTWPWRGRPR